MTADAWLDKLWASKLDPERSTLPDAEVPAELATPGHVRFRDRGTGLELLLHTNGFWRGWLHVRGPDGPWREFKQVSERVFNRIVEADANREDDDV